MCYGAVAGGNKGKRLPLLLLLIRSCRRIITACRVSMASVDLAMGFHENIHRFPRLGDVGGKKDNGTKSKLPRFLII